MPRFFIEGHPEGEYFLGGEDGRHAAKSLRMRAGEELTLSNGEGTDFLCTVQSVESDGVLVKIEKTVENLSEPRTKISVCQCLAKGDKLETVTQKAVELGAHEIRLVTSSRCVVKTDKASAEKKTARLQKIALEAAKQSGRGIIPKIFPPADLKAALEAAAKEGDIFFFYERGEESLKTALKAAGDRIFVFIGPEGGFAPEEAELAESIGAKILTLGRRILRTETAPLAALSAILYEKGEMEL